jgi:thiazole/oxazole-forming peptide maturase SagD family component
MRQIVNPYYNFYLFNNGTILAYDCRSSDQFYIKNKNTVKILLGMMGYESNSIAAGNLSEHHPGFSYLLLNKENEKENLNSNIKVSYHPDFRIFSKSNICHECVLRWFPRNDNLDKYIEEFNSGFIKLIQYAMPYHDKYKDSSTINPLLEKNHFIIVDGENEFLTSSWYPLIHPECKSNHNCNIKNNLFKSNEDLSRNIFNPIYEFTHDVFHNYHYLCTFNSPSSIKSNKKVMGWGVDKDKDLARTKSIMEAMERFHLMLPYEERIISSGKKLESETIKLNNAFLFNNNQYDYYPFENYKIDKDRIWVRGKNLTFNKRKYIPLEYIELRENLKGNNQLLYTDSTGTSAHFTEEDCIKNGLLEVIERAGQYAFWVNRDCIRLDMKLMSDNNQDLKEILYVLKEQNIKAYMWINSIIPHIYTFICCLAIKTEKGEHLVFGSASDFNFYIGLSKAIEEAFGQLIYGMQLIKGNELNYSSNYDSPVDHLKFYLNPKNKRHLNYYFNLVPLTVNPIQELDFNTSLEIIKSYNWDVVTINRGSNLSESLGIKIYQTKIPQLPSLGFNLNELRLPHIKVNSSHFQFLNIIPHPFC